MRCEGPDPGWQPLTGDSWSPAPASPGWVIGCMVCMVTSARDITIKTSRILRMSAVLNGIRNPNCPDYNAHSGLSAWSCVNLIKYLAPSISCGPQTLETNTEYVPLTGSQGMQRSPSLLIVRTVSGERGLGESPDWGHCARPIVRIRTCRGMSSQCIACHVWCTVRNAATDNETSGRKGCRSSMLEGGNFLAHCALGWGQETDVTVESN